MELIRINIARKAVLLDVDGVLLACTEIACDMYNADHPDEEPICIEDVKGYGVTGTRADGLLKYYDLPELYDKQEPYEGAQEFVRELSEKYDVYFLTAVPDHLVEKRGKQLEKFFPWIKRSHVFYGQVKERFIADFSLDDAPGHILAQFESGSVKHPVIMRRPWNESLSGIMSVAGYKDFLTFLEFYTGMYDPMGVRRPCVIALVGPAGSNKGKLCGRLIKRGFERLPSCTTSAEKSDEAQGYRHISVEEFRRMRRDGEFLETTCYAGNYYGIPKDAAQDLLKSGRSAVTVVDICGAVVLKRIYKRHCLMVYVDRNVDAVLDDLIKKHKKDELKSRLRWLGAEQKNRELCEISIVNDDSDAAAKALEEYVEGLDK